MANTTHVDPFTLEIVKNSLIAIGEEMFYTLARTSMSPIIYEVLDFASGLTDARGSCSPKATALPFSSACLPSW